MRALTPAEYGRMAAELSAHHARVLTDALVKLDHDQDATSLIYHISQRRDVAFRNLVALGIAAYVAYIEIYIPFPDSRKPEVGAGVSEVLDKNGKEGQLINDLLPDYLKSLLNEIRGGGVPKLFLGTHTHETFIASLVREYSGRTDIDDFKNIDSFTLGPYIENYYLEIMTGLRNTLKLRF